MECSCNLTYARIYLLIMVLRKDWREGDSEKGRTTACRA
jgi:hypothetical protein